MTVLRMPGTRELPKSAPKTVRSMMETVLLTPAGVERWKRPPFQRELKTPPKVLAFIEELKAGLSGGVIDGVITLGKLGVDTYLVDGQHRIYAFIQSGLAEAIADVRTCTFDSMGEMGEEFARLNQSLVRMTSDDILRGLEGVTPSLAQLRKACGYVGYTRIRASERSPMVSMSTVLRTWFGSVLSPTAFRSALECVKVLDDGNVEKLSRFLSLCWHGWGRDEQNYRLWGALNLAILMWLWRRLVLREQLGTASRVMTLSDSEFTQCLMALSANHNYTDWLQGRALGERDRSPCYSRIRAIFSGRLGGMGYSKPTLPQPDWSTSA